MMQMRNDPISQTYPITGMDLFSRACPDLSSFKNALLTGKFPDTGSDEMEEMVERCLQAAGIEPAAYRELNLAERLALLVFERACLDAGLDHHHADDVNLSLVIHDPDEKMISAPLEWSPERMTKNIHHFEALKEIVIMREDFNSALETSLNLLQNRACTQVALVSFFPCTNPGAIESVVVLSTGVGCMLFSNPSCDEKSYADLIWEQSPVFGEMDMSHSDFSKTSTARSGQSAMDTLKSWEVTNSRYKGAEPATLALGEIEFQTEILDKYFQYPQSPHFLSAPMVRLIHSALNLNNQTLFPDLSSSLKPDNPVGEEMQTIRPWFPLPYAEKHECACSLQDDGVITRLEKDLQTGSHPDQHFLNFRLHLLPISFENPQQCLQQLDEIKKRIIDCSDLAAYTRSRLSDYKTDQHNGYTLAVLGSSGQELLDELERARQGLPKSFEDGRDWQTPAGSYCTPLLLGPKEKIAFVYPGAFGTYVGMGREIFYLFPQLYDALQALTSDAGNTINETTIFPEKLTRELKESLQDELNGNPTQMISSGVCFSHLFTVILRDIFKVKPDAAFGYSLGENSMMFAMDIWTQADAMRTSLEASSIFHSRVSGAQNAIREFWGMPTVGIDHKAESIWANYVLMAPFEKVKEAIQKEPHVYITHINAPRQVVIGGESAACRRVADNLQCMHLQAPYRHAIHCPPVVSEFDAFMRLHDWPVENQPNFPIYTAAEYAPLAYDSKSIARCFAKMLTNPIDFPRLVNLAYQDGARIFIELGAGSNCSKWVEATLKGRPHTALSINQNNVDDHVSILRLVARLVSHQIPLDLTALLR
jgi:PfaB family protein